MRRLITLPLIALLAMTGMWLGGAAAALAAPQHAQRCAHNTPLTVHNRVDVEAHLVTTCGHYFEVYANWQQVGYKFGVPKKTGYDNKCAHPDCSTSGGTLFEAGVKRVSDGRMFCEYSCGSAPVMTTAVVVTGTGHGAMITGDHRRCTPQYSWNWHRSSHPEYIQAKISAQCIPNWAIQTDANCSTRGGGTYDVRSGVVTNENTEARATCNHLPLTDQLQNCYVRVRTGSGTWKPWQHVCSPIGTSPDGPGRWS